MLNLDPPVFDLSSQAAAIFLVAFVLISVIGVLNILIAQVPAFCCHRDSSLPCPCYESAVSTQRERMISMINLRRVQLFTYFKHLYPFLVLIIQIIFVLSPRL